MDSLLGLSMRAGHLVSGEYQVLEAIHKGTACLVVIATDASDNTKKRFHDQGSFYEIPVIEYGTKLSLAGAIGRDMRSSAAVCDPGLAEALIKQYEADNVQK